MVSQILIFQIFFQIFLGEEILLMIFLKALEDQEEGEEDLPILEALI